MTEQTERRPAVEARGITKAFGRYRVLRGVDLRIAPGEFLALLGPNGAGKTTFLRILATLSRPTDGRAWINGQPLDGDTRRVRRQIGLVSHQTFLYGDLTAEENLRFYGRLYQVSDLEERIAALLQRMGLYERRHDPVRTFSRGMQQRLSIARAVLHDPPVLLLDEPDTGLDQQAARMLRKLLSVMDAEQRTILMTTHQLERAREMSTRVAILAGGQIRWDSPTAHLSTAELAEVYTELVEQPANSFAGAR
ncbi:MAG: heme ABC exporter ATP-binding protein CcmA [Anaerolineae bacterium]